MSALFLDTHIWLWYAEGDGDRLPVASVKRIEDARRNEGLLVPAISVWELAILHAKGRVQLSSPLRDGVQRALQPSGIGLVPLDADIAAESTLLTATRRIASWWRPLASGTSFSQREIEKFSSMEKLGMCGF